MSKRSFEFLVEDIWGVDLAMIWRISQKDIPALKMALEKIQGIGL